VAFICSISITNIVGKFIEVLERGGIAEISSGVRQNNTSLLLWRAGHNALVIPLGLTDHLVLLGLSVSCGSIQPINPELAVDVTSPSD
jgi:hypothetical protein